MTHLTTAIVISGDDGAAEECERGDDDARGAGDKIFRIPADSNLVIAPVPRTVFTSVLISARSLTSHHHFLRYLFLSTKPNMWRIIVLGLILPLSVCFKQSLSVI